MWLMECKPETCHELDIIFGMSSKEGEQSQAAHVIGEKGAGGGGRAGELQLLSIMAVPRNHPLKRSDHQKENKGVARQHGDVREKFCQAHLSASGVIVLEYRGEGGVPIRGL